VFLIYGEIKAAEDGTFLRQVAMQIVYSAKFYYLSVPWWDHVYAKPFDEPTPRQVRVHECAQER